MFDINKKMMLCAAVGGDIEDYKAMMPTKLITLRCPHAKAGESPVGPVGPFGPNETEAVMSSTIINLKQLAFDRETMGYVGRCERCGKIYYKGAI